MACQGTTVKPRARKITTPGGTITASAANSPIRGINHNNAYVAYC